MILQLFEKNISKELIHHLLSMYPLIEKCKHHPVEKIKKQLLFIIALNFSFLIFIPFFFNLHELPLVFPE